MNVQIMVYIYLAVCVSMIVFNLGYVAMYRRGDKMSRRTDSAFCEEIKTEVFRVEKGEVVNKEHIKKLCRRCRDIWNLVALDETLTNLETEHKAAVDEYVEQTKEIYISLAVSLKKKEPIQKAHYCYMVKKYGIGHSIQGPDIENFMMELVMSSNLYCRQNALDVLYDSGKTSAVVQAMKFLSEKGHFHHEKFLTEGLLSFNGSREALIDDLLKNMNYFSSPIKIAIMNFIRFGSGKYCHEMYAIMCNETEEDEMRFSAMRYFGKYKYEPAEGFLKDMAKHPNRQRWEYASIAASSLAAYPGEETISILKECLSNAKWYVRYNAAISLEQLHVSYLDVADILDGNDRYAREALQYRMEMNKIRKRVKGGA